MDTKKLLLLQFFYNSCNSWTERSALVVPSPPTSNVILKWVNVVDVIDINCSILSTLMGTTTSGWLAWLPRPALDTHTYTDRMIMSNGEYFVFFCNSRMSLNEANTRQAYYSYDDDNLIKHTSFSICFWYSWVDNKSPCAVRFWPEIFSQLILSEGSE